MNVPRRLAELLAVLGRTPGDRLAALVGAAERLVEAREGDQGALFTFVGACFAAFSSELPNSLNWSASNASGSVTSAGVAAEVRRPPGRPSRCWRRRRRAGDGREHEQGAARERGDEEEAESAQGPSGTVGLEQIGLVTGLARSRRLPGAIGGFGARLAAAHPRPSLVR